MFPKFPQSRQQTPTKKRTPPPLMVNTIYSTEENDTKTVVSDGFEYEIPIDKTITLTDFWIEEELSTALRRFYPHHPSIFPLFKELCNDFLEQFNCPMTIEELKKIARRHKIKVEENETSFPLGFLIELLRRKIPIGSDWNEYLTPWSISGVDTPIECRWGKRTVKLTYFRALAIADFAFQHQTSAGLKCLGYPIDSEQLASMSGNFQSSWKLILPDGEERFFENSDQLQEYVDYYRHLCLKNEIDYEEEIQCFHRNKKISFSYD